MRRVWPRSEWNSKAIRMRVGQPMDAVCPEVVVLPLFPVSDDWRPGCFKALDRVANRVVVHRAQQWIVAVAGGASFNESNRSRNASYRLRGDGHWVSHHSEFRIAKCQPCKFNCSARLVPSRGFAQRRGRLLTKSAPGLRYCLRLMMVDKASPATDEVRGRLTLRRRAICNTFAKAGHNRLH